MSKLKCVLLIDDSEFDNFLHKMIIEKAGIADKVDVTYDGNEALKKCAEANENHTCPELILLDLNMPGMGGKEFLDNSKQHLENQNTAIYILSTTNHPSFNTYTNNYAHVKGFLTKPLTVSKIKQVYEECFGNKT